MRWKIAVPAAAKLLFVVTEDWYFCSHRLQLARAAARAGFEVVVVTRVRDHLEAIERAGVRALHLPFDRGGINPFRAVYEVGLLLKALLREEPKVIHLVAMKPIAYGGLALSLARIIRPSLARTRVLSSVSGLGSVFIGRSFKARAVRLALRALLKHALSLRGAIAVVQNREDRAIAANLSGAATRIELIEGSGIDLERFSPIAEVCSVVDSSAVSSSPREPLQDKPSIATPLIATFVGRMLRDKGVLELVEAARTLDARGLPIVIRLVGEPDPENPTSLSEQQLLELRESSNICWQGRRTDIDRVWRESDIAVLPSYREGLPQTLLEAAACGVPMVATDVPGCSSVCLHQDTGLLVPARDPLAIADALTQMYQRPQQRLRMGQAARRLAEERFGAQTIQTRFLALYQHEFSELPAHA